MDLICISGASSGRILVQTSVPSANTKSMDPSKLDTLPTGCVLVARPSPSPQARGQTIQPDMPIPAYEASLVRIYTFNLKTYQINT